MIIRKNKQDGSPLTINDIEKKYRGKKVQIEVYQGKSVSELNSDSEEIRKYSKQRIVTDYEVLSPTKWEKKFTGESTGVVDTATLVITVPGKDSGRFDKPIGKRGRYKCSGKKNDEYLRDRHGRFKRE